MTPNITEVARLIGMKREELIVIFEDFYKKIIDNEKNEYII